MLQVVEGNKNTKMGAQLQGRGRRGKGEGGADELAGWTGFQRFLRPFLVFTPINSVNEKNHHIECFDICMEY